MLLWNSRHRAHVNRTGPRNSAWIANIILKSTIYQHVISTIAARYLCDGRFEYHLASSSQTASSVEGSFGVSELMVVTVAN